MLANPHVRIVIADITGIISESGEMYEAVHQMTGTRADRVQMYSDNTLRAEFLVSQDLVLVGMDSWTKEVEAHQEWLSSSPSVLILSP